MSFDIVTGGCEAMIRQLAIEAGHGANTWLALDSVAGKILDTCIARTPMSTQGELIERVNRDVNLDFARYDLVSGDGVLTTNQGRRGNLPAGTQWTREGGAFHIMRGGNPRRWSNARWARYQATAAQREADLAQSLRIRTRLAKASIGLTRQSWVQAGDDLGLVLHSARLDKIRSAIASNGTQYRNGRGLREERPEGMVLTLENFMPVLTRGNGAQILQSAIDTRLSAFDHEVSKGVFDDLDMLKRRYPDLQVSYN